MIVSAEKDEKVEVVEVDEAAAETKADLKAAEIKKEVVIRAPPRTRQYQLWPSFFLLFSDLHHYRSA